MRNAAILALVLLATACKDRAPAPDAATTEAPAVPAPAAPPPAAAAVAMPAAEVARLARRIEACQHFAGEEPYDPARAAELRKQVAANCPGNEAELKRLRDKYAADRKLTQQLEALAQQVP
jgi:hypothetical protein